MIKDSSVIKSSFIVLILLFITSICFANTPPPTVKQNIGMPDTTFENLNKLNCAYCHAPEKLTKEQRDIIGWTFKPPATKPGILADRHHAKITEGLTMSEHTQAPFGVAGDVYTCFSCHGIKWNEDNLSYELSGNFKDCQNCHREQEGITVHHLTQKAQNLDCKHCHGDRIDNPNDGHYIPTKKPTDFTPHIDRGKGPNGEGACTFCHKAGVDIASGIIVNANATNHHSTGVFRAGTHKINCTLCHQKVGTNWGIRGCQNCHGIKSIHSIQADSNGDGIIKPGGELSYFGHIGNEEGDCKGCHNGYFDVKNALDMLTKASVVPEISDLSRYKIVSQTATTITVNGQSLTNVLSNDRVKSVVILTNNNGTKIELVPSLVTLTSLIVTIPNNLNAGNYYLRVKKGSKESSPVNIVVVPKVAISEVSINNDELIIAGKGFGKYMDIIEKDTKILLDGLSCSVETWSDEVIVTKCPTQCGILEVYTIFGEDIYTVNCDDIDDKYQQGYQASYYEAFKVGNSDKCKGKTWSIDVNLRYDTKYNQGYTDGYIYAYDLGWESSCANVDIGDYEQGYQASYDIGLAQGSDDKCRDKSWSIDIELRYNTQYEQGYAQGYIDSYDNGYSSFCE